MSNQFLGVIPSETEVILQQIKYKVARRVGSTFLDSVRIEVFKQIPEEMLLELIGYVLHEELDSETATATKIIRLSDTLVLDKEVSFSKPDGWWQHWKHDHQEAAGAIIKWLATRKPVRYKTEIKRVKESKHVSQDHTVEMSVTWKSGFKYPEAYIAPPQLGKPVKYSYQEPPKWEVKPIW